MVTSTMQELFDREAIKEVRARFAQALVFKDWALFESLFAEELDTDYTDFGIPPQKMRREELTGIFKQGLSREGIRTQHISSNFQITVSDDTAQCVSAFLGQHYIVVLREARSIISKPSILTNLYVPRRVGRLRA